MKHFLPFSLFLFTLINCGGVTHVKYHTDVEWQGSYAVTCNSDELSAQLDEATAFVAEYVGQLENLDPMTTTITLQGESRGNYIMRRNGETIREGQWESRGESEIELTVDGDPIVLEVERVAGEIHIISTEAIASLCTNESGTFEGESHSDGEFTINQNS